MASSTIMGWNLSLLAVVLVTLCSSLFSIFIYQNNTNFKFFQSTTTTTPNMEQEEEVVNTQTPEIMEIFGVTIERNPNPSKLAELGVTSWPKWSGSPSKYPWTFKRKETMYLLEGKVKVACDGYDGSFEIGAGDLVEFPKGMKITWEIIEAVIKHYSLGDK